jgi:hypothetical protein|tara:strand:- start:625 stop:924 length:300 start_codon:yes stop_codon:yes gene_type:complete
MTEKRGLVEILKNVMGPKTFFPILLGMSIATKYNKELDIIKDVMSGRYAPVNEKFVQNPYQLEIVRPLNQAGEMEVYLQLPNKKQIPIKKNFGDEYGDD